ncbi:DNA polymerase III subunit delta [Alkalicoccus daliensis]|uniref:DNA polymerase III subunit delta n=1 Tax=Alkalicoccus daliensis TaxID=745820 RepID=A0A1H0BEG7_9BACI|nr:DNA polymerase III subunit delta [Alkalicoccus daliensis]SDN44054.1 DNA polymerase III, delta subunit [Alkalicoccus daliensis]
MSYLDRLKEIKQNNIAPVYLLYGNETYLMEDVLQKLITQVLAPEEQDMKLLKFDMTEESIDTAVEEAYTFPFMGGKKVVVVKDAYFLTAQKRKEKVEHDITKLNEYALRAPEETVFIILAPYEKLDERKKVVKQLRKQAAVLDAKPLNEKELRKWLEEKASELNTAIDSAAVEKLLSLVGDNLLMLTSEMNKLATHSEDGVIRAEAVETLVSRSLEHDIFSLVDHVVKSDIENAMRIYRDLIKQKEAPLKILALMVRQFRILYQVKQLVQQGYGEKMIASRLKLHPFAVKLAAKQSRQFEAATLLSLLDDLAELDFRIKTGKIEEELGVELFLLSRSKPSIQFS